MRGILSYVAVVCVAAAALANASMPIARYRDLPTLKEQNALEKKWVQKRYEVIPEIMKKQYVRQFCDIWGSLLG